MQSICRHTHTHTNTRTSKVQLDAPISRTLSPQDTHLLFFRPGVVSGWRDSRRKGLSPRGEQKIEHFWLATTNTPEGEHTNAHKHTRTIMVHQNFGRLNHCTSPRTRSDLPGSNLCDGRALLPESKAPRVRSPLQISTRHATELV